MNHTKTENSKYRDFASGQRPSAATGSSPPDRSFQFLAEASHLLSSSLDYETTLSTIARLAVPQLADWCIVDMLSSGGTIERIETAHADPAKMQFAKELQTRYPVDPGRRIGVPEVLRTGKSELYPLITDEMLQSAARDQEHLRILREAGMKSLMIVPMVARGRILGAITFVSAESGVRYDESDQSLAEDLARRVALAVDNARLYREALRASEEAHRSLFETMTQGVVYHDGAGNITSANPAAERILGRSLAQLQSRKPDNPDWHAIHDNGVPFPASMHPAMQALATGQPVKDVIMGVYNPAEDQHRWIKVDAVPQFRPGAAMPYQVYTIFDDITERRRAEEAIRVSEKLAATGRLAASIAHEINNPLESITNLLYLLENDPLLHDAARGYAALAQQELARVTHIARQTLGFYRDTSSPVPVKMASLLDNVLELYRRKIEAKRLKISKSYDVDREIPAFPGELRQVFSNLVVNAIESVPVGGSIRIHVFASRNWRDRKRHGIQIVIADTGPGIPPENRHRVFEPFFTTKGERGTGLGLWVSQGIVQKHGGFLRFRSSTNAGKSGTVFSVFLPFRSTQRAETRAAA